MKAIILAAGLGTRMGEFGKEIPKCLLTIGDKTILEIQIEIFKKCGINEIILVIGNEGECWTEENRSKIKMIHNNSIINFVNHKTHNSYSLKRALDSIEPDDVFVIDGDVILSPEIIMTMMMDSRTLVLSKPRENSEFEGNKILSDEKGRILKLSRNLTPEILQGQKYMYCGVKKINRKDIKFFREVLDRHEYRDKDLGFVLNELIKTIPIYHYPDERSININRHEELEEAKIFFSKKFVICMQGYTAAGKSTIAKKISVIPHTHIYHS
ncbi:MAG: NTP transferase domain-containing protein, partial [Nanoarchaeota archaeon]